MPISGVVFGDVTLAEHRSLFTPMGSDGDFLAQQHAGERHAGELTALGGVEYLRLAVARQCFLQSLDTEIGLHCDRYPPSQHIAAEPVNDGHEVDEPLRHRDVADVRCPDIE
jgi:hypothetical protein